MKQVDETKKQCKKKRRGKWRKGNRERKRGKNVRVKK